MEDPRDNDRNYRLVVIEVRSIADEENVDALVDAFSKLNLSDAIELCRKYPRLLTKTLPNDRLVLNELIKLGGRDHQQQVVEILSLVSSEFQNCHGILKSTALDAAISVGAIEIARFLASVATVVTKSFKAKNLDIPLKLLKSCPEEFILASDIDGNFPLCEAAKAPRLFRRNYRLRFLPKCIYNVLGPRLEISGMDFLIDLGKAIRDLRPHNNIPGREIISRAMLEAIKHENFDFILMLINFVDSVVSYTNDEGRNMYMLAIAFRCAKVFSLCFCGNKQYGVPFCLDKRKNNLLHMVGEWTPPISHDRISNPALQMKRELIWFKEVEKLVPDDKLSRNKDDKTPRELFDNSHKNLMVEAGKWMKASASSWAIVGPLIIGIMFAAAIQVPGGSLQDKGYPVFLEKWLFKVYTVLVAMSLFLATISVLKFLEISSANHEEEDFLASLRTYNLITGAVFLSLATMLIAFCVGLFLTLHGELAIFLPIAAVATFISTKFTLMAAFVTRRTSIFDRDIGREVAHILKMLNRQQRR